MKALHEDAKNADIIIMNEIGVDPGIDHMSAMQIIHKINAEGGKLKAFRSFCGGLIAPDSDDNPWNYKFTWNPRNVVLAGQGGLATFIVNDEYKYIPYHRLFGRIFPVHIEGYGDFEGYANRDSLSYRSTYGIDTIPTLFRGTLRRKDFCTAWNVFVELGMTDNSMPMEHSDQLTPRNFINAFLPYREDVSVEDKFKSFLGENRLHLFERFKWLGLFENEKSFGLVNATPAQLLENILVGKWVLNPEDKDMLVMYHEFEFVKNEKNHKIQSSMICIGEDQVHTAMSKTVGLPLGMVSKMILNGEIAERGVMLPLQSHIYEPILEELNQNGISFNETETVQEI
jgi:saccharopine dehydrogenase-like NADP-dependent oxidoreductase